MCNEERIKELEKKYRELEYTIQAEGSGLNAVWSQIQEIEDDIHDHVGIAKEKFRVLNARVDSLTEVNSNHLKNDSKAIMARLEMLEARFERLSKDKSTDPYQYKPRHQICFRTKEKVVDGAWKHICNNDATKPCIVALTEQLTDEQKYGPLAKFYCK
jgi:hypothetical protein